MNSTSADAAAAGAASSLTTGESIRPTLLSPSSWNANVDDTVILYQTFDNLTRTTLKHRSVVGTRCGTFHHDDLIGKPWGSKVRILNRAFFASWYAVPPQVTSRDHGKWAYLMPCNPELYTQSIPKRTQVLYLADISMVCMQLDLCPGARVVEAGFGSGSLTMSLARAVYPSGQIHSFEYHEERALAGAQDLLTLGLGEVASVTHANVCEKGFAGVPDGKADAMFLDLPAPWDAIHHARKVLRIGARFCSFSPCVEQVHKAIGAMETAGFRNITTMEVLVRPWQVKSILTPPAPLGEDFQLSTLRQFEPVGSAEDGRRGAHGKQRGKKRARSEDGGGAVTGENAAIAQEGGTNPRPSLIGFDAKLSLSQSPMPARSMRGHTAYLTFATLSAVQPTE